MKNNYYLLRHGQTIYQAEKRDMLYLDSENMTIPLTKEGEAMAERAGEQLENKKIDLIFTSDFQRTKQTAEIVARKLGLEVNLDKRLEDLDFGAFWGGPLQAYKDFFSEKKERFNKRPPGGETWNELKDRLENFLVEIENKYQGKTVLLVSHADPIWLLYGLIKGVKTEDEFLAIRWTEVCPELAQLIKVQA